MYYLRGNSASSEATAAANDPTFPSPETQEDYLRLAQTCWQDIHGLVSDRAGWSSLPFDITVGEPDVQLFERPGAGAIPFLLAEGSVPCSVEQLLAILSDKDISNRQEWEKELMSGDTIEVVTPTIQVVRAKYKAPFPVTNREFVAIRCLKRLDPTQGEGEGLAIFGCSINHPQCFADPAYVRAGGRTAFIIRPIEGRTDKCFCSRFMDLDPKGNIPTWVINKGKVKAAVFFVLMRKYIENRQRRHIPLPDGVVPSEAEPKQTKQKEKAPQPNIAIPVEAEGEADEFFDASSQFPWREDFDQQTEKIGAQVQTLQRSLDTMNQRLQNIEQALQGRRDGSRGGFVARLIQLPWRLFSYTFAFSLVAYLLYFRVFGAKVQKRK